MNRVTHMSVSVLVSQVNLDNLVQLLEVHEVPQTEPYLKEGVIEMNH